MKLIWVTLAAIDSKSIAIVILEGNAWGLIIRSGRIPECPENGISTSGHNCEQTPFCPCLLLNLSPIIGFLERRKRMLTCSRKPKKVRKKGPCKCILLSNIWTKPAKKKKRRKKERTYMVQIKEKVTSEISGHNGKASYSAIGMSMELQKWST